MLRLSRRTDYALLITTALARPHAPVAREATRGIPYVSVSALARAHRLPYRFAAAIVSALARAGILESREGTRGGYRLARAPHRITIAEVVRATEGFSGIVPCLDASAHFACAQKAVCPARHGIPAVQRLLLEALARHTVADLVHHSPARNDRG